MNFDLKVSGIDGEYQLAVAQIQVLVGHPPRVERCEGRAKSRSKAKAVAYALEALASEILKAEER